MTFHNFCKYVPGFYISGIGFYHFYNSESTNKYLPDVLSNCIYDIIDHRNRCDGEILSSTCISESPLITQSRNMTFLSTTKTFKIPFFICLVLLSIRCRIAMDFILIIKISWNLSNFYCFLFSYSSFNFWVLFNQSILFDSFVVIFVYSEIFTSLDFK